MSLEKTVKSDNSIQSSIYRGRSISLAEGTQSSNFKILACNIPGPVGLAALLPNTPQMSQGGQQDPLRTPGSLFSVLTSKNPSSASLRRPSDPTPISPATPTPLFSIRRNTETTPPNITLRKNSVSENKSTTSTPTTQPILNIAVKTTVSDNTPPSLFRRNSVTSGVLNPILDKGPLGSTNKTPPPNATLKKPKSSLNTLEDCLQRSCQIPQADKVFDAREVQEAIGRVSFAVQYEKSGAANVEQSEEAFAKASAALGKVLSNEKILKDEECKYWMKLFEIHVNKHLNEIVLLADSTTYDEKKTPVFYDKLEDENTKLKTEQDTLKSEIQDLKNQLFVYKRHPEISMLHLEELFSTSPTDLKEDTSFGELEESIREKLDGAKIILQDIKIMDKAIEQHVQNNVNFLKKFITDLDKYQPLVK